jgi:hypothetical protein
MPPPPIPGVPNPAADANLAMAKALARAMSRNQEETTYQTYTRYNPFTNKCYTGRTSGTGTPQGNINARAAQQAHLNAELFDPPILDKSSTNSSAIRGREQLVIDVNGGAQSAGGYSRNMIRGVSEYNPYRFYYEGQALNEFGEPFKTGPCTCN